MTKQEAELAGKQWIPFADIPPSVRLMHQLSVQVCTPGLIDVLRKTPDAYEDACEHWFNNALYDMMEAAR